METRTEGEQTKHKGIPCSIRCAETLTFVAFGKKTDMRFQEEELAEKDGLRKILTDENDKYARKKCAKRRSLFLGD